MLTDSPFHEAVKVTVQDGTVLSGRLSVPVNSKAIIIFAHGSGSSHQSPRNKFVADVLEEEKFATLLIDLLSPEEQQKDTQLSVDILSRRLLDLRDWVDENPYTEAMYTGVIATSSAAAAALQASVELEDTINSLVCRGGKPDMVTSLLSRVSIPVLFLVGSEDTEALDANKKAVASMSDKAELKIIEGAGHSFKEEGKLEIFAEEARDWFLKTI